MGPPAPVSRPPAATHGPFAASTSLGRILEDLLNSSGVIETHMFQQSAQIKETKPITNTEHKTNTKRKRKPNQKPIMDVELNVPIKREKKSPPKTYLQPPQKLIVDNFSQTYP